MSSGKRYFWLKLKEDFFQSKRIKKLRNMAGGDTYLIIYLKLQLKAMKTDGIITFDHLEQDIATELALDLDETPDNVAATMLYLLHCGLAESSDNEAFFFPYAVENVGSENSSAQRVREYRDRQKALHCNTSETHVKRICNGEIEIEKDIDKDIDNIPPISPKGDRKVKKKPPLDEESFETFWKAYPRKVAKAKAKESFARINPDAEQLQLMLTALEKQKRSQQWTKDNGQFIPHPTTWLNQKRWEDEGIQVENEPPDPVYDPHANDPNFVDMGWWEE